MTSRARAAVLDSHSIEAAALQTRERVTTVQIVILDILRDRARTDEAIVDEYERRAAEFPSVPRATPQSIRSRRAELVAKGHVIATGHVGFTRYGNKATVWALSIGRAGK